MEFNGETFREVEIVGGNEEFTFQLHKSFDRDEPGLINFVHIETIKALDREEKSSYNLDVRIIDSNGNERIAKLAINILDINDNPPVFDQDEYHVSVNKTISVGASLVAVRALDSDTGRNSEIHYEMSQKFESHFSLDRETGLIRTRASFQCNGDSRFCPSCIADQLCSILVHAKDGGQPQQSAYTVVKVHILDSNDHDPQISFRFLPNQTRPYSVVSPSTNSGSSVAAISVTDQDNGMFGETTLEIISGNEARFFELFSYGSNLYVLRVTSNARFNGYSKFTIGFKARDKGKPPRNTEEYLEVRVEEINEFEPRFTEEKYQVEIAENMALGSSILIVSAIDSDNNDKKDKNQVIYSIAAGNQLNWFTIGPFSGLITNRARIDRETQNTFSLKIRAQDRSPDPKSAYTTVKIVITDLNDDTPTFGDENISIEVSEDTPIGAIVHRVEALDRDEGQNGTVFYSLEENHYFKIDEQTGDVIVKSNLDYESITRINLRIIASDQGLDPKSSSMMLTVNLKDVNDNSPMFYPTLQVVQLKPHDTFDYNKPLLVANALDSDSDQFSKLTYDWMESPVPSFLSLNRSTGEIFLRPNHQRRFPTKLGITVSDNGGRRAPVNFEIQLLTDGYQRETSILNLSVEESDEFTSESPQVGQVVFETLSPGFGQIRILDGDPGNFLEIDPSSGEIRAAKQIDRELVDKFNLTVGYFQEPNAIIVKNVVVTVVDINDNRPEFVDTDVKEIIIDPIDPLGIPVFKILADDKDSGRNAQLKFALEDPLNILIIEKDTGIVSQERRLDFSQMKSRDIEVTVSDNGSPSLSASKTYRLKYLARNLYTPTFDFDHYEYSVSESLAANSIIAKVLAVDEDDGLNGELQFSITRGAKNLFGIFPDGSVYLKKALDREEIAFHSFTVEARDHGDPPRSSETTVLIYVTDDNDNAPVFTSKNYVFNVFENEPSNSIIGRVSAYDKDIGRNAELEYTFASKSKFFSIDLNSGFISLTTKLDREKLMSVQGQDYFQIDVIVKDNGIVPQTDTASISIVVLDRNDNSPSFTEKYYKVSVSESSKIGSEIITLHAKDEDKGDNGRVLYSISNTTFFAIDADTGIITLAQKVDREERHKHVMVVTATDNGDPQLSANTSVYCEITDVNDNAPFFLKNSLNLKISEGTKAGHVIYHFKAVDRDQGENGWITYSLGGNNLRNSFNLDSDTGILKLSSELDRELRDHLDLVVTATDHGVPSLSSFITVSVDILDINDNAPRFPTITWNLNVPENVPVGSVIFEVEATDPDLGRNGIITFELEGSKAFKMDKKSGVISTAESLDRESVTKYEMIIIATDGGDAPRSTRKEMIINIDDVNDSEPEFESLPFAIILPGSVTGTTLLDVTAVDEDEGDNGKVFYELSNNNGEAPIAVNASTGRMYLTRDFLKPERDQFEVTVAARDNAVLSARRSASATVTIVSGSEIPGPSFTKQYYQATIKENSPIGTPVVSVELSDFSKDGKFYLIGCESDRGQYRDIFEIDSYSGQIRTKRPIDREVEGGRIVLDVVALIDNKMSGCKVDIACLDENDTAPKFTEGLDIVLSEEHVPGHLLAYVKADDPDLNAQLSYSLSLNAQAFLKIDSVTGALTVIQSIDHELNPSLDLGISVSDGVFSAEWRRTLEVIN